MARPQKWTAPKRLELIEKLNEAILVPEVEIRPGLLVRGDGLVKNISGNKNAKADWHSGCVNSTGYKGVGVPKANTCALVHRLVAEAFAPNPHSLDKVDHINGDILDNRAANLRWVTQRQNCRNKIDNRAGKLPGCTNIGGRNKLNPWQAQVKVGDKTIFLGNFATEKEAHSKYILYCKENGLW